MSLYDNYNSLVEYLKKGKCKYDRPSPETNPKTTRIVAPIPSKYDDEGIPIYTNPQFDPDWVGIKLHQTVVVKFYKDGRIQLDSGGWRTRTTRDRINNFLPRPKWNQDGNSFEGFAIRVFTDRNVMYLSLSNSTSINWWDKTDPGNQVVYFEDGIIIHPDGRITNSNGEPINRINKQKEAWKRKQLNRIKRYCDTFIEKFCNQEIEPPGPGDCWYCLSHIKGSGIPPIDTLTPDGIKPGFDESDHIKSHVDTKYYVPSLLHNAIQEMTYNPSNSAMVYGLAPIDKHNIAWAFKAPGWESQQPIAIDMTKRRLKMLLGRYVRKHLGFQLT